jgi:hypothetical protein
MLFRHEIKMKETDRLDGIDPNRFSSRVGVWTYVPALVYINTLHLRHVTLSRKSVYIDYNLVCNPAHNAGLKTGRLNKTRSEAQHDNLQWRDVQAAEKFFFAPKLSPSQDRLASRATLPWRGAFVRR